MKTMSSRDFDQDAEGAKRAAADGLVSITDRGEPSHVLMTVDDYRRMSGNGVSALDLLSMPADDEIEFDPPKSTARPRPADPD